MAAMKIATKGKGGREGYSGVSLSDPTVGTPTHEPTPIMAYRRSERGKGNGEEEGGDSERFIADESAAMIHAGASAPNLLTSRSTIRSQRVRGGEGGKKGRKLCSPCLSYCWPMPIVGGKDRIGTSGRDRGRKKRRVES